MRFLIDMPLPPLVTEWLAAKKHDAVHASEIGLDQAGDEEILERARTEGRVVVTADLDFPRLLAILKSDKPGIVLFRGGRFTDREVFLGLTRIFQQYTPEEIEQSIITVEPFRLRRRDLPLE